MKTPIVNNQPAIVINRETPEGNAYYIMGTVKRVLRDNGYQNLEREYVTKATSGNYNNLCNVSKEYVNISFVN